MTDLPFGRGGSPLQNLIARGYKETYISAIKCQKEIDSGPIYLKKKLQLNGSANDIFERCNVIIQNMIIEILSNDIKPVKQTGQPTFFKRRKPKDGNITKLENLNDVYNYIRMLDHKIYPNAFLTTDNLKFEFKKAKDNGNSITANVKISKRDNHEKNKNK